ncbi:hypothetical protein H6F93_23360 [Leptolyngbya sp. FACHB-671]|uniref:hypothetical protein n=1 Tax=Leptolyngbya sp. FACHB-671 TaxID=2692812 RepID=UPI0016887EA5|nr:hypothetical protein [Leptolyngbya sp. FACHB-671]MBD2070413.1 hypothetical protein [Leptolyngbya sp. FACHB-671]
MKGNLRLRVLPGDTYSEALPREGGEAEPPNLHSQVELGNELKGERPFAPTG